MSNAVDILVVNGPDAGAIVCQERPVPATIPVDTLMYATVAYDNRYWVAVVDAEADNEAAIEAAIAATGWQPSWDLLRALGEHP
jgi:hypothetical protein